MLINLPDMSAGAFISQEVKCDPDLIAMLPECLRQLAVDADCSFVTKIKAQSITITDNPYDCQGCGQGAGNEKEILYKDIPHLLIQLDSSPVYGWLTPAEVVKLIGQLEDLLFLLSAPLGSTQVITNQSGAHLLYWCIPDHLIVR
jgi:hypothetical protein